MTATPAGVTYADYLSLDQLLVAQHPKSGLHDEMLFIVIHQTKELCADGTISGGMLPKIAGALDAAKSGVNSVPGSSA